MMDDKEYNNIYTIPANYTDSGRLFGGMIETRNAIETAILLFILGYPQFMWMHVSFMVKVVIMTVTLLPAGIVGLMGIGGDSLLQFIIHMIRFWVRRRKLHMRRIGYRYDQTRKKRKKRTWDPPQSRAR